MAAKTSDSTKYSKMLEEVDAIAASIEDGEVDLDQLVTKIERGYTLIESMKERLDSTETRIEEISAKFGTPDQG